MMIMMMMTSLPANFSLIYAIFMLMVMMVSMIALWYTSEYINDYVPSTK